MLFPRIPQPGSSQRSPKNFKAQLFLTEFPAWKLRNASLVFIMDTSVQPQLKILNDCLESESNYSKDLVAQALQALSNRVAEITDVDNASMSKSGSSLLVELILSL